MRQAIEEELNILTEEFSSLPDDFTRYSYLVELSALLPEHDSSLLAEAYRYQGCQSQVWLKVWQEDGNVRLLADSDTLIIRGILYLYCAVLDGAEAEAVRAADFDLLSRLGIGGAFSSQRTVGIRGLLKEIKGRL